MLSALSSAHHAPHTMYNAPHSYASYNRTSPLLPAIHHPHHYASPAMQERALHASVPHAASMKHRQFVISPGGTLRVFGYSPAEGPVGTSIVVNVEFSLVSTETTFLRVVVGNRALSTAVRPASSEREGEWELEAVVPEFEVAAAGAAPSSSTVPLTVQALNGTSDTLDSVTFGKFNYTYGGLPAPSPLMPKQEGSDELGYASSAPNTPDLRANSATHPFMSRKSSRPSSRSRTISSGMSQRDVQTARGQLKKQSLIRARRSGSEDDDPDSNYRASLQLETPTDSMGIAQEWDADERRLGRRLVRFSRVQEGCTLHVVCEAIKPADYSDGDTVVSCIYRPSDAAGPGDVPLSQCCITSVDIIFLLECLVGDIFNIEEKNRIRRNLEGFRPKTVSKNKPGTEEFFQKIMDFPAPKPRNIEKDVKVFDWAVLPQALDKIISKYTLYPNGKKVDGRVSPPNPGSASSTPLLPPASISGSYSTASSPPLEHASTTDHSYFYPQPSFHRSHYVSSSMDAIDSNYVTATALSSAGAYDSFLPHPHSHSSTPSPTPLLSPPAELSGPMTMSYIEPSQSLYSYPDHSAYGSSAVYAPSFDPAEFQRTKMSPATEMQQTQAYS